MKTTWAQLQVYMNTYIALKTLSPITDSRAPHVIFFILSCRPPPPIFSLLLPCRLCISSSLLQPRAAASTPQGSAGRTSSRAAWRTGSSARRSWPPSLPCSLPGQERGVVSGRPETRCGVAHGRPLPSPPLSSSPATYRAPQGGARPSAPGSSSRPRIGGWRRARGGRLPCSSIPPHSPALLLHPPSREAPAPSVGAPATTLAFSALAGRHLPPRSRAASLPGTGASLPCSLCPHPLLVGGTDGA